jgi:hypothetical protein
MNGKLRQLLHKAQSFEAKSEWLANLHLDQFNSGDLVMPKTPRI